MATQIHGAGPAGQRSPGLDLAIAGYLADNPPAGGGGASTLDDLTDVDTTGATTGDSLTYNGTTWVADAPSAGTVTSTSISDSTATGRAVLTAADAATARTAIGAAPATQAINAKTGAYTLVASDAGKLVTLTLAAPADLTVPANVFTAGQRVDIADRGTARVTVVAGASMTVNPPAGGSLVMEGRYAYASLVFVSPTEADLVGLVAAA